MRDTTPAGLLDRAEMQAGLVTRQQALRSGLTTSAIASKVVHGRWAQVHRGVYATFTGSLDWDVQLWAAVLYAGTGARLSYQTAATIIRLSDSRSKLIHVTIPAGRRVRPPQGVVIHISSGGHPGWRFARGIPPHTLAEETIIDLAHAADRLDDVIGYVTIAFARNLTSDERLRLEAAARKKLRWRADLDRIISSAAAGAHSPLEFRYDRDVEQAHGLPPASSQARFRKPDGGRGRRDRYYEKYRLIIELDGRQFHPAELRGLDRARDNQAAAAGGTTLRYGWEDITRRPCTVAVQVHAALTRRGYVGPLKPCSPICGTLRAAG